MKILQFKKKTDIHFMNALICFCMVKMFNSSYLRVRYFLNNYAHIITNFAHGQWEINILHIDKLSGL